jgi:hypothetical protein
VIGWIEAERVASSEVLKAGKKILRGQFGREEVSPLMGKNTYTEFKEEEGASLIPLSTLRQFPS